MMEAKPVDPRFPLLASYGVPAVHLQTPSMDDKDTRSPPVRTVEQYHADCAAGIQRIGHPTYKGGQA